MRRLSLWLRAHPAVGDSVIAVLLFLADIGAEARTISEIPVWAFYTVGVLLTAPLALRRKWTIPACWLLVLAGVLQVCTHGGIVPMYRHGTEVYASTGPFIRLADLALPIALYTMVAYTRRRQALLYLAALLAGTALWEVWRLHLWKQGLVMCGGIVLVLAFCWALGEMVGARRAYHREVEQRVKLLETERDQQARIAVAEERTRIARELHDVVAHAVSVIVVQADGAAYAVRAKPELAERAVRTISTTGRDALGELRRMLGVLRDDGQDGRGERASDSGASGAEAERVPQPGAGGLAELTQRVTSFGVPVRLHRSGSLEDLPAGIGLGVYRIVQEALTNTFKHAGAGATADVDVARSDGTVTVTVSDDGSGAAPTLAGVSGGNGLIGMRERAGIYGGTVHAGPRDDGGWLVRVELPLPSQP